MIFLWCVLTFPLYYFYLLVAVRFDIAFNKHILCVWLSEDVRKVLLFLLDSVACAFRYWNHFSSVSLSVCDAREITDDFSQNLPVRPGRPGIWLGCEKKQRENIRSRFFPGGCYVKCEYEKSGVSTNILLLLANDTPTANCIRSIERCHFQWSRVTHNPDFKGTPLYIVKYTRNGTRWRHRDVL